ncbi:flavodoxin domain-containing protein [Georgenia sp. AZ-5]|uniref:flavodoxin domain-containing protein n=1 Tax=Georgenia sp. AZ-5 TaxID=3367526 RepID=UPI003754631C
MRTLIAYASRHGATAEIAERIAGALRGAGHAVDVAPVSDVADLGRYDAAVIGSSVYMGHWHRGATAFVLKNAETLGEKPVWLFSSGPLGAEARDKDGADLKESSAPTELPELVDAVRPRGHRVFFGALRPGRLNLAERAVRKLPAGRDLMPEGDVRDWADIDHWAREIAGALSDGTPAEDGRPAG